MKKKIELNLCDYCEQDDLHISQGKCLICEKDFCNECHYSKDWYWIKNFLWQKNLWTVCIHCIKTMWDAMHKYWYKRFNKTKDYRESWTWMYIQMWWYFREIYDKLSDIAYNDALRLFIEESKRCMSNTQEKRSIEEEIKKAEKEYKEKISNLTKK